MSHSPKCQKRLSTLKGCKGWNWDRYLHMYMAEETGHGTVVEQSDT